MTTALTLKHVGHGPNGTAAYVVLDARGKYVKNSSGAFIFSLRQAQHIMEVQS